MRVRSLIPQTAINYLKHFPLAVLALLFYRFPSRHLKIIGVTGTDGKTTTVNLIYHILREAGKAVAMISTVSAVIQDWEIDTGFHVTSPNPWMLQRLLREMVKKKIEYVVLEVTSHGLDQFRVLGIDYEVGVITNITPEHLDYHKTYQNYLRSKARLFSKSKIAVLNKDDNSFEYLSSRFTLRPGAQTLRLVTYGIKNSADFTPKNFPFTTLLAGEYNRYNCLAAIATAKVLGVPDKTIRKGITSFKGVVGRMEEIKEGQNFRVVVDFAHTPNALEQSLRTLKSQLRSAGRLIAIFGAAGLRDRSKRPLMGKVASRLADLVILTAEDPREEKVEDICQQIAFGCQEAGAGELIPGKLQDKDLLILMKGGRKKYMIIPDRREAIELALLKLAKKNDIVAICGKGHEKSMCYGKTEYPWSDQEAAKTVLKKLVKSMPKNYNLE